MYYVLVVEISPTTTKRIDESTSRYNINSSSQLISHLLQLCLHLHITSIICQHKKIKHITWLTNY